MLFGTLLMSLAGKVAYEFVTGDLLFVSDLNFIPLPLAHLIGGIVGVFAPLGCLRLSARKGSGNNALAIRSNESIPRVDPTSRSHQSIPRVDPTSRSHQSIPPVDPTSRSHQSIPRVDPTSRSNESIRCRKPGSSCEQWQGVPWKVFNEF